MRGVSPLTLSPREALPHGRGSFARHVSRAPAGCGSGASARGGARGGRGANTFGQLADAFLDVLAGDPAEGQPQVGHVLAVGVERLAGGIGDVPRRRQLRRRARSTSSGSLIQTNSPPSGRLQCMPHVAELGLERIQQHVALVFDGDAALFDVLPQVALKYSAAIICDSALVPPSVFQGMSRSVIDCGARKKPRRMPGPRILENEPMYMTSPGRRARRPPAPSAARS